MVVAADAPLAAELVTDEQRPAFEAYLEEVRKASDIERLSTDRPKTGVFLGVHAVNPVNGEQIPVWAADYVLADYGTGAIMAVPGAGPARLGLRRAVRPADRPHRPAARGLGRARRTPAQGPAINSANDEISLDGLDDRRGQARDHRLAGGAGAPAAARSTSGCATGCCPGSATGARRSRSCTAPACGEVPVPEDRAAGRAARAARRRPEAEGRLAAGGGRRTGSTSTARPAAARRSATPTRWTRSSTRPGTSCATARRTTTPRPFDSDLVNAVDAVRHLRRRRRARGAAPAVRPVLHQGAARHGPGGLPRAVLGAAEPGRRDQPGQEDEQVAGQRRAIWGSN